jgi:hypothetical protein
MRCMQNASGEQTFHLRQALLGQGFGGQAIDQNGHGNASILDGNE